MVRFDLFSRVRLGHIDIFCWCTANTAAVKFMGVYKRYILYSHTYVYTYIGAYLPETLVPFTTVRRLFVMYMRNNFIYPNSKLVDNRRAPIGIYYIL